jgi:hypothetical protein
MLICAHTSQRGHDDPVPQLDCTEANWSERESMDIAPTSRACWQSIVGVSDAKASKEHPGALDYG